MFSPVLAKRSCEWSQWQCFDRCTTFLGFCPRPPRRMDSRLSIFRRPWSRVDICRRSPIHVICLFAGDSRTDDTRQRLLRVLNCATNVALERNHTRHKRANWVDAFHCVYERNGLKFINLRVAMRHRVIYLQCWNCVCVSDCLIHTPVKCL